MSQLRCNGKVPTIVFGEVARDIVACKEVVDWLQYPVPGFEDFIVIITESAFGMRCFAMILELFAPMASAATIYS